MKASSVIFPVDWLMRPYVIWCYMPIPNITHLQFLVLNIIGATERSGRYIRERLAAEGVRGSLPSFYQSMSRLEDGAFVKGSYRVAHVEGQSIKERWYK